MNVLSYAIVLPIVLFLLYSAYVSVERLVYPVPRNESLYQRDRPTSLGIVIGVGAVACWFIVIMSGMAVFAGWVTHIPVERMIDIYVLGNKENQGSASLAQELIYGIMGFVGIGCFFLLLSAYQKLGQSMEKQGRIDYVEERARAIVEGAVGLAKEQRVEYFREISARITKMIGHPGLPAKELSYSEKLELSSLQKAMTELARLEKQRPEGD